MITVHTEEVKQAAALRVVSGLESSAAVARSIPCTQETLARWVRRFKLNPPVIPVSSKSVFMEIPHFYNKPTVAENAPVQSVTNCNQLKVSDDTKNGILSQSVVLFIPDLHCPFEHPHALLFLQAIKEKYKPTHTICAGDEIDAHANSRWPHDPDGLSAGKELKEAIEHLIPFYIEFPDMMVCESNHTIRAHKAAFGAGIPSAFMKHIATVLNAPDGWEWRNHWIVDGVRYFHGDAGRSGQYAHMAYLKMFKQSLVHGHIHSHAGVNYEGTYFGANSGCLIDKDKYAFAYAKNMPIEPSLGCTIIFGGRRATFVPMLTDNNNNWIGQI